jgi:hypothetical protein
MQQSLKRSINNGIFGVLPWGRKGNFIIVYHPFILRLSMVALKALLVKRLVYRHDKLRIKDDDKISLERQYLTYATAAVVSVAVYSIQPVIQYTSVLHKNKVPDQSMARVDQFISPSTCCCG